MSILSVMHNMPALSRVFMLGQTDPTAPSPANGLDTPSPPPGSESQTVSDVANNTSDAGPFDFTWNDVHQFLTNIWETELFSSGGNPVQLSQLVIALLVLLLGILFAKRVVQLVGKRLAKINRINPHATQLIEKILFYGLVIVVTLVALPMAGIPITIFTVLGGAFAIGVGFGAQNLFNNLISGFILMLERPIRVGDIIVVGDQEGRVEEIGNRSTRVRRSDGVDVLVPNSKFLENDVVNWTLRDSAVRGTVTVGIAYGSPTQEAAKLIKQATHEHAKVLKHPEPIVIFDEFGDNSLNFKIYFWTEIRQPMDLRRVQSDIRFSIDAYFREAQISIAFPQRDVHLDSITPIQVQMVDHPKDSR